MKNRKAKVEKDHDSDHEEEDIKDEGMAVEPVVSREEELARTLENVPVIPDSEVSPAAFIFKHTEEHDDLNLYEEK